MKEIDISFKRVCQNCKNKSKTHKIKYVVLNEEEREQIKDNKMMVKKENNKVNKCKKCNGNMYEVMG